VGIAVALIGRLFVPRRGSVLAIGIVTALLKMLSIGGVVLNPMIGILAEALLAELALLLLRRPGRLQFMLAGGVATLWPFFHPFLTQGILAGSGIFTIYQRTIQKGAQALGLPAEAVLYVLAALIALHIVLGLIAGFVAWDAGRLITARLRPGAGETTT
jgi:ABC-type thiamin/hydroxymethylpyrimidine transport system permease subunit